MSVPASFDLSNLKPRKGSRSVKQSLIDVRKGLFYIGLTSVRSLDKTSSLSEQF